MNVIETNKMETTNTQFPAWYNGEGYYLATGNNNCIKIDNDEVEEYSNGGDILVRRKGMTQDDNLSYYDDETVINAYGE